MIKTRITASIGHRYDDKASRLAKAISKLASNWDSICNFESYVAQHGDDWYNKYASDLDGLISELETFASFYSNDTDDVESSTSTNRSKRNRYVRSNYVSCAERFDPVNSSPEELTEYIYDALDEAFDETNFVEEDLEQYKDTFTNELIKALNRLNLGDMQVETDFGTLTGDTKKIANTVVKAYIQAYKDGRLG